MILVIGMHITRQNRPKSWGIPNFLGECPCNDNIISQKHHVLVQEMRMREISQEEEGVMADIASLKAFKTQILKKLDNHSGQKLKYEQF